MAAGNRESTTLASGDALGEVTEHCDQCEQDTPHAVSISITATSADRKKAKYAREPCRTTQCRICGEQTTSVINHS